MARDVKIAILGDASSFTRSVSTAKGDLVGLGKTAEDQGSKFGKFRQVAGVALGGVAVLGGKFAADSVKAYSEAEEAQKRLADAFARFPALADSSQEKLQKLNSQLQKKTKFDDDAIASGQAVIAQFGLTGKQVESVTSLLVDYASKTGKDMPAAAQDLGKAMLGNAKALKNIGIKYKATGDTAKDFANIQQLLTDKVGGFAEREGDTAAGKVAILKNQFGELQETVGSKLVPAMSKGIDVLLKLGDWLGRNKPVLIAFAGVITAGLVTAFVAWAAAAIPAAIATAAAVAPILAVVAGIALLVAGVIYAYKHWGFFRNAVQAVASFFSNTLWPILKSVAGWINGTLVPTLQGIASKAGEVIGFIKSHWQAIVAILAGPVGVAVKLIIDHWQGITNFFKAIPGKIGGFFSGLAGIIFAPFSSAFSAIKRLWNSTVGGFGFSLPSWIPGVGGKSFHIPKMHTGGIFGANEGLALLKRGEGVFTPKQMAALAPAGGGGSVVIHVNALDPQSAMRGVLAALKEAEDAGLLTGTNLSVRR